MKNKPSKEQVDNLIYLLKQNSFDLLVSKTADFLFTLSKEKFSCN